MPSVNHVKLLPSFSILLSLSPLSPTSWFSSGKFSDRENHMLIMRQHHCISNSMLVNQNELKSSSSGLGVLKISCSICWVLRIKTTGGQLVAALNKIWLLCPIGCYYMRNSNYNYTHLTTLCFGLAGRDQERKFQFPGTKAAKEREQMAFKRSPLPHHNPTSVKFTLHLWMN